MEGTAIFAARRVLGDKLPLQDEVPAVSGGWWARLQQWLGEQQSN